MKLLFLTIIKIDNIEDRGIYPDLLRKFRDEGHEVFIATATERREKKDTSLSYKKGVTILNVKTLNLQKINILEKGLGMILLENHFLKAIKKHFKNIKFDLILYTTPPITLYNVINFIKKRDNAYSYLLLKDIFPQNAVDMKMMKNGSLIHKYFVKKEKKLYHISDTIGCMSDANKNYILKKNFELKSHKVEVNPNSIIPILNNSSLVQKNDIRIKHGIPINKKVFIYGGNLGKPQGIDFLIETVKNCVNSKAFFLIIGTGTEFESIKNWFENEKPKNALLLKGLPKNEYDLLLGSCDVGLIFLHKDFTIPNFPSRLLSYLENSMPVIAATDSNTDIGIVIENAKCGYKVQSGDINNMLNYIDQLCLDTENFKFFQQNSLNLLQKEYLVERSYKLILEKIENV